MILWAVISWVGLVLCTVWFGGAIKKDEGGEAVGAVLAGVILLILQATLFWTSGAKSGYQLELSDLEVGKVYVTVSATDVGEDQVLVYAYERTTSPEQAAPLRLYASPPPMFTVSEQGDDKILVAVTEEVQDDIARVDGVSSYSNFGEFLSAHRRGSQYILEAGNSVPLNDTVRLSFVALRVNEVYLECTEQIGDYKLPRSAPLTVPSPCPYDTKARYGDVDLTPLHIPATIHVLHVDEKELEFTITWHEVFVEEK